MAQFMETAADRLKQSRAKRYATAAEAARALSLSAPTVRSHENGGRKLKWDWAVRYAAAYRVDPEWIMSGKRKPNPEAGVTSPIVTEPVHVYGVVAAGLWLEDGDWQISKFDPVPVVPMKYRGVEQTAWKVLGPSMDLAGILDGGYVVTVPYWEVRIAVQDNDLVVVERRDGSKIERTVKQAVIGPNRVELWPRSSSSDYQTPILIPRDHKHDGSQVEIVGLVVGFYRPF